MARNFLPLILLPGFLHAAIWPEQFGAFRRISVQPLQIPAPDRAVWEEYGFQEGESASYSAGTRKLDAQAWRLNDSTGALGAFEWLRPAGARNTSLAWPAAETASASLVAAGNYLLRFERYRPKPAELQALLASLPAFHQVGLPSLTQYMPKKGLVPGSERYVLGPATLERFFPGLPPSAAGFQFSGEAQTATYRLGAAELRLALFYYPTPAVARSQLAEFQKLPGVAAKRSGPLVGVLVASPDPQSADALLDQVEYQAKFTWSERVPTRRDNVGDLVVNAFLLTGFLLLICLAGGLAAGGIRWFAFRYDRGPMTLLNLEDRR
jgi:hypothetical protein